MGDLQRRSEAELAGLDDEALVAYVVAARAAGEQEAAQLGLRMFAFGMQDRLLSFVKMRMEGRSETEIEEVAARALEDSLSSIASFAGASEGEARAYIFRIARRRIADFFRAARLEQEPLEVDRGSGAEPHPALGARADDIAAAVDTELVVSACLAALRPDHRAVIELCVFEGFTARETAERVNGRDRGDGDDSMTEQNVHQIVSRFRKDLRQRLEER